MQILELAIPEIQPADSAGRSGPTSTSSAACGEVRRRLTGESMAASGLFDMAALERLVGDHQAGRRDFSAPLWTLMMFESFLRQSGAVEARAAA